MKCLPSIKQTAKSFDFLITEKGTEGYLYNTSTITCKTLYMNLLKTYFGKCLVKTNIPGIDNRQYPSVNSFSVAGIPSFIQGGIASPFR